MEEIGMREEVRGCNRSTAVAGERAGRATHTTSRLPNALTLLRLSLRHYPCFVASSAASVG